MIVVCSDAESQARHAPTQEFSGGRLIPYPESPARYSAIRNAIDGTSWAQTETPQPIDDAELQAVHEMSLLRFLQETSAGLASGEELAASVFAHPDGRRRTDSRASLGYFAFDTTPVTSASWSAARSASAAASTAAALVAGGEATVYALGRPPGHHAGSATFGGYCYLNHAAVAARKLSTHGRVAVVDVDYHHGNGTQQIFFEDGSVYFLSLHADPTFEYPCYWGYADESGSGEGTGSTHNVPLPEGTDAQPYIAALQRALEGVAHFDPRFLVVSVGFDTYGRDPLGTFRLDVDDYADIADALIALDLPTVIVQEGGYHTDDLGLLATRFLEPFQHHTVGRS